MECLWEVQEDETHDYLLNHLGYLEVPNAIVFKKVRWSPLKTASEIQLTRTNGLFTQPILVVQIGMFGVVLIVMLVITSCKFFLATC